MAQDASSQDQKKLRFGLHVHIFVTVTLVLLFLGVFLFAGVMTHRDGSTASILTGAISGVVVFGALLWLVARYCSNEILSYWNGLRLIAAYVSFNIGALSLLFSFVCITVAIMFTALMTLVGAVSGNRQFAQHQFLRFVQFISDHRMYQ